MKRSNLGKISATVIVLAIIVIAAVVGGVGYYLWSRGQPSPSPSPSPSVSPSPVVSPSPGVSPSPVISPSPITSPSPVPSPSPTSSPSGPVTLAYLAEAGPEPELIATTFGWYSETFPSSQITYTPDISPRDIARLKLMAIITDRTNDYQLLWSWLGDTQMMIDRDVLVPLDDVLPADLIAKAKANIPTAVLNAVTRDGKIYTVPTYWNSLCLFYRTDLFNDPTEKANFLAQYGYELRPPETWQEWIDTANFFTRPEQELWGTTTDGAGWAFYWNEYGASGLGSAGAYPFVDLATNTTTVNSPEGVQLFQTLYELSKISPPGWQAGDWFSFGDKLFAEGKLAMWNNWYYPWPTFQNTDPTVSVVAGKVGITHTPTINSTVPPLTNLSGGGVGINPLATDAQKAAAVEYLTWMLSDPVQKRMAMTGELFVYARNDILADPEVNAFLQAGPFITLAEQQQFILVPPDVNELIGLWVDASAEAFQKIVRGEMTAQQAADWYAIFIVGVLTTR